MKTCYIIGGGDFDGFYDEITDKDLIIAADKGYTYLDKEGIKPHMIIGDFDSAKRPDDKDIISLNPIKDYTDTRACIDQGIKKGYDNFIIYGGLGGRESHSFANIRDAYYYKKRGISISLKSKKKEIFVVDDTFTHTYDGDDFYISIFSLDDQSILSIRGLFYELNDYNLKIDDSLGVSNETCGKDFTISLKKGAVLIIKEDKDC